MGCVSSRKIDREERVEICKERKKLMKQLLLVRTQFASAQMSYLQSLKNTGATLRQFSESGCLLDFDVEVLLPCNDDDDDDGAEEEEDVDASSPTSILPPPPPPLPPFSPDHSDSAPPLQISSSSWDIWDAIVEEESWEETNTEFDKEEDKSGIVTDIVLTPLTHKAVQVGDGVGTGIIKVKEIVVPRIKEKKKTVSGIIKEIDEYFLKASASGRNVIVILDINKGCDSLYQDFGDSMRRSGKSSKVFSALSWNWSSKSLPFNKDTMEFNDSGEPCKPGAHGISLEKIFSLEETLYRELKEEENTKLEYGRKTLLLQKYEAGVQDLLKTEEARSIIETLQYDICSLQQSISETNSAILKLIYDELHPQLIVLSSGLMHMWRIMYECHQFQNRIAQQMNHFTNHPSIEPTTDYHRQSTTQLEAEVNGWYISFCNLLKSQREYVQVLNRWVQLTDFLVDGRQENNCLSIVQHLCEHWKLGMDHLPDKVAAEAIKSFHSVIHSIVVQQAEEHLLQKKLERLERKLQREMNLLDELEKKFESSMSGDILSNLSPNHPLGVKRAKIELFKKRVEDERLKYLNSVSLSHAMALSNLQGSLPTVFHALTAFSTVCSQAFEAVNGNSKRTVCFGTGPEIGESPLVSVGSPSCINTIQESTC